MGYSMWLWRVLAVYVLWGWQCGLWFCRYAGALFAEACLKGLNGVKDVVECSYVQSTIIPDLPFFSSKVIVNILYVDCASWSSVDGFCFLIYGSMRVAILCDWLQVAFSNEQWCLLYDRCVWVLTVLRRFLVLVTSLTMSRGAWRRWRRNCTLPSRRVSISWRQRPDFDKNLAHFLGLSSFGVGTDRGVSSIVHLLFLIVEASVLTSQLLV